MLQQTTTYHAGIAQARAYRVLRQVITKALKPHDLTMMQWAALGLIYEAGISGLRINHLAEQLDTTISFATTTINGLESRDMITRLVDPADNRARIVALVPKYKKAVQKIELEIRGVMRESLAGSLSVAELEQYITLLNKLARVSTQK